jgi:hypothetical protein
MPPPMTTTSKSVDSKRRRESERLKAWEIIAASLERTNSERLIA